MFDMEEQLPRGSYRIFTWGCQMNEDDTSQMAAMLEQDGYIPAPDDSLADVILLNTCSVRAKPEQKAYTKLGELSALKRQHPETIIGVCGCMAQKEAPAIRRRAPHVDLVIGTGQIDRLPSLLDTIRSERNPIVATGLPSRKDRTDRALPMRAPVSGHAKIKSFVSIMYGCDKFCHFCIVPVTRGKERSRSANDIVQEVERLASLGTREVTLLGQTVNSYGKFLDEPCSFAELLARLDSIEGIERIRYTSPYPRDFSDELIHAIADLPKVCPQVHLPVQVGDDDLLRRMNRGYTLDQYRDVVSKLRQHVHDVSLTTDIMLGFPGETEREFENTLDFMGEMRYDAAYMFAYSPREGTKAALMDGQIDHDTKIRRLEELIKVQNDITLEIHSSQCGRTYNVLVDGKSRKDLEKWCGLTPQGKTVNFSSRSDESLLGLTVPVKTETSHLWGFHGVHTVRNYHRLDMLPLAEHVNQSTELVAM